MSDYSYEVKGAVKIDRIWQPHSKVVSAPSEALAKERFYMLVGSKHRLDRNSIRIEAIRKIE